MLAAASFGVGHASQIGANCFCVSARLSAPEPITLQAIFSTTMKVELANGWWHLVQCPALRK
ncbi:hypothetical protein [Bradyrhizobium sp. SEMIA]|uniref:hypothetical protein n=1 Tax=Bradyrhizobium sp. SEMIA TaxID=2597515 RepID=UPI0018A6889C|nr:hypothetical protein [Bradyrhizobium sp. SEMIA]QOG17909.1 hypothetical protein FOM02_11715 [Bradyrhizobium sp. SEMIA]